MMRACSALSGGFGIDSLLDERAVFGAKRGERPRPGEVFLDGAPRGGAELARELRMFDEEAQRAGEVGGAVGVDEPAVLAMADELAHRRQIGGDDGDAAGHRLEDLERRAALLGVARAVGERRDGEKSVARDLGELLLRQRVVPLDAHAEFLGELLVRLPRLRLARGADDEAEVREIRETREGAEERLDALPGLGGAEK